LVLKGRLVKFMPTSLADPGAGRDNPDVITRT